MEEVLRNRAPAPSAGSYADGFAPLADRFASQLQDRAEVGAGLTIYHRGRCVVNVWGGSADTARAIPWASDTRVVVFSVTKGLVAMAMALLSDRGQLDWDVPVASYWPGFAAHGKGAITVRTLVNHRAGLVGLDHQLTMADCTNPDRRAWVVGVLEQQRPAWEPGTAQGYHAITFGLYVRELFERIAGESLGGFLRRELFEPLDADVSLGTPPEVDARIATLYSPRPVQRAVRMVASALRRGTTEGRIFRSVLGRGSLARAAFGNPKLGARGDQRLQLAARPPRRAGVGLGDRERTRARARVPAVRVGRSGARQKLPALDDADADPRPAGLVRARPRAAQADRLVAGVPQGGDDPVLA